MGGAAKFAAAALCCRLPACQTKGDIRSKLSARSMQIYAQTFATDLCLDLYRTLTSAQKAKLLRGEVDPWETSPLNNSPLLTGLEKRYCQKILFSHKDFTTLGPKMVFSHTPRGPAALPPTPGLGDPGGTQNPPKNGMENRC